MTGQMVAQAAQALLGTPFRLYGRDARLGLDCMGLVEAALRAADRPVRLPFDYTLKMVSIERFAGAASRAGLAPASGDTMAGDILLLRVGPCQFHLGIIGPDDSFIHAHAGLRRVVSSPLPQSEILDRWRLPGET